MNPRLIFAILLVMACLPGVQALAQAHYSFEASASGESRATIVINSTQATILPLPEDVHNPQVQGATFTLVNDGIEIMPSEETILVTYTSSYHISKQEGVWTFIAEVLPMSVVDISLPSDTQVIRTKPRAALSKDDGLSASWILDDHDEVLISYVIPLNEDQLLRAGPVVVERFSLVSFEGAVFVLILAGGITWWILRRNKGQMPAPMTGPATDIAAPEEAQKSSPANPDTAPDTDKDLPHITDTQMNILRAANHNEAKVLKIILKHNGHLKRNELERESGISKSSLASALKNLEGKNIIHIDRSFFVHYLTLSDWFKGLK